jgi:hypothetical protein
MQYTWFLIFYAIVGLAMVWYGAGLIRQPQVLVRYLVRVAEGGGRPRLLIRGLRYLLMYTVASFLIALFPLALYELMYTLILLILIFSSGRILLLWDDVRPVIAEKQQSLERISRKGGFLMLSLAVLSFLLWYRLMNLQYGG